MATLLGARIGKGFRIHSCACQQRIGSKLLSEFIEHPAVHGSLISHSWTEINPLISTMWSSIGRRRSGRTRMD